MLAEQQTEWIINNNLINKGWHIDGDSNLKNVYFQKPPYPDQQKKLKGKKPDYILYQTGTNRPIAIIEAKKSGINLEPALDQGTEYAKALNVPLVFAMNGAYCETRFVPNNKELILNGEEVRELIRETEALKFLEENTNEVYTLPKQVIVSRNELIKIFEDLNDTLRSEGLRAGIERFSEFANILFLKLLSENEKESYWDFIKKLPDNRIIKTINDSIIKEIENKYGGNVFTPLSIQNPATLRKIIERIDPLVLSTINTDIKGDAFEYFLKQTTSTNNDLGEYFTPRHIIKTVINLVAPRFKEKVYDPFCGTGGFLTEAFNYIKENNIIDKQDVKQLKQETLYGGELTTTARIAKMNMILHGDGHSGVRQIDSLSSPIDNKFDVVVTNIPFSQPTEYGGLYYNGISKNHGDSACVLHCLRSLKRGGRMALIVPDGFLSKPESKQTRKFLLSKAKLKSIISLPANAFKPYTTVKTSILYFVDCHINSTSDSIWFFDVKSDGYSLDNHRKPVRENDLKKINYLDFNKKIEIDSGLNIGLSLIELDKIKENKYNLLCNKYKSYDISHIFRAKDLIIPFSKIISDYSAEKEVLEPNKMYKVLGVRSYGKGIFLSKEVLGKDLITKTIKSYQKVKKDCLFWCKVDTKNGAFGITKKEHENCIASNNMCMYPINTKIVNPEFLELLFSNKNFYSFLNSLVGGSTNRRYIKYNELLNVVIGLPDKKEQDIIVSNLNNKRMEINRLQNQVNEEINQVWQSEEENEPVADKSVFDMLINKRLNY